MRDPYKMFNKLAEKNDKIRELVERAKEMSNEDILALDLPKWQKNILSEIRMKKLLKKSMLDVPIREIKPWEGVVLNVRKVNVEFWVKQAGKENLFEVDDIIGITGENVFWGYTYLTGCENVIEIKNNSLEIGDMSKDEYLEYYKNNVGFKHAVVDQTFGNTGNNLLDAYGVKFK